MPTLACGYWKKTTTLSCRWFPCPLRFFPPSCRSYPALHCFSFRRCQTPAPRSPSPQSAVQVPQPPPAHPFENSCRQYPGRGRVHQGSLPLFPLLHHARVMRVHLDDFQQIPHILHTKHRVQLSFGGFVGRNHGCNGVRDIGVFDKPERPVRIGKARRNI
ncbi:hypothetical protein D3C80_1010430 [compost metagenome]